MSAEAGADAVDAEEVVGEDTSLRITELVNAEAIARSKTEEAIWLASLIRELSKDTDPDDETAALLKQYQARAIALLGMKRDVDNDNAAGSTPNSPVQEAVVTLADESPQKRCSNHTVSSPAEVLSVEEEEDGALLVGHPSIQTLEGTAAVHKTTAAAGAGGTTISAVVRDPLSSAKPTQAAGLAGAGGASLLSPVGCKGSVSTPRWKEELDREKPDATFSFQQAESPPGVATPRIDTSSRGTSGLSQVATPRSKGPNKVISLSMGRK